MAPADAACASQPRGRVAEGRAMSAPVRAAPAAIPLVPGLAALAGRYDGYVVDLWGVLHDGVRAYPDAVECVRRLKSMGKRIVVLSNAPRRAAEVAARTARLGITAEHYDHLVCSGEETWRHLKTRPDAWYARLGRRALLLVAGRDRGMLDGLDLEVAASAATADFIFCTGVEGPGDRVEDFEPVLRAGVAAGIPMVCANPDLEVVRGGVREICAGTLAARYEALGGFVRYHGKPHPSVYTTCFDLMGVADRRRILAIGDSLRTDVAGADAAGLDSLLITGGIHAEELGLAAGTAPDPARLAAVCARSGHHPTWAAGLLAW